MKKTRRKNTCGPNDVYLHVIWACGSSHILSRPIPMCFSFIWHGGPPDNQYPHIVGACALSLSPYPISLLPISTLQAVAHSSGWGCCGAVVGVVVAIVIVIVM